MLCSGFAKEGESVFVDLLTYADLEMLKARKTGQSTSGSVSSSKAQHKRYIILTYQNEFDRVHYPLPLAFEETPNTEALKRTIRRLRSQADTKISAMPGDSSVRNLTQLRQENTELRHRLRQSESRASKTTMKSPVSPGSQQNPAASELALAYSKLKKQHDTTRKELSDLSIAHDRLKNDSAREISKWKAKFVTAYESAGSAGAAGNAVGGDSRELRRRVAVLERDLEKERLEHRKSVALHKKEISELFRRQKSAPLTGRSTSAGSVGAGSRASSSERARDREMLRERQRSSRKTGATLSDRAKNMTRSVSPAEQSDRGRNARSISPASSTGKKFDPTEWVNQQNEKKSRSSRQAWGGGSRYYRESGYSSANSDQVYTTQFIL
jgi:coiled-coil domain-containing protein 61